MPEVSILGQILFVIYVIDIPQAAKCDFSLQIDDSCFICQRRDSNKIEKQGNEDFLNIYDWFVDKIKSIPFVSIFQKKSQKALHKIWGQKSQTLS